MPSIRLPENIASLLKMSSTTLQLSASRVNIGGLQYSNTNPLTLNLAVIGPGGLDAAVSASTTYYVYAIVNSGVMALIGSTNNSLPSGYSQARILGGFYVKSNSTINDVLQYKQGRIITDWVSYTPVSSWTGNTTHYGRWRRVGDSIDLKLGIGFTAGVSPQTTLTFTAAGLLNGLNLTIDTTKFACFGTIAGDNSTTLVGVGTWAGYDPGQYDYCGTAKWDWYNSLLSFYIEGFAAADRQTVRYDRPMNWGNDGGWGHQSFGTECQMPITEWAGSNINWP